MLLCWLCGGLFALCGALCYGELGARFPRAGGEYVFLRESFGRPLAFLSGWISLIVGFSAPIAAAAIALATCLFQAFTIAAGEPLILSLWGVKRASLSPLTLTAIAAIVLFSLIHMHSLQMGSHIQNGLTVFKIALIVLFALAVGRGRCGPLQRTRGRAVERRKVRRLPDLRLIRIQRLERSGLPGRRDHRAPAQHTLALVLGTAVVVCLYLRGARPRGGGRGEGAGGHGPGAGVSRFNAAGPGRPRQRHDPHRPAHRLRQARDGLPACSAA
ncbi:MAG: amino acid permease [Desulfobacterales bacterium]|nr:amino acid permease [Desulfobacterales bacterium]